MNLSQVFGSFVNQVKGEVGESSFTLTGGTKTLTVDETISTSTILQELQTLGEGTDVPVFYTVRRN